MLQKDLSPQVLPSYVWERQGIQHYKPVKHWGGEQKLKEQQEHDARKLKLCRENGVILVIVDYYEEINEHSIKSLLDTAGLHL